MKSGYNVNIDSKLIEDRQLEQRTREFAKGFSWKMYRFEARRHTDGGKVRKRIVDVLTPLFSAAELGVGAHEDETVRSVNAAPSKMFRSLEPSGEELASFYAAMSRSLAMELDVATSIKLAIPFADRPSWRGTLACIYKGLTDGVPLSATMAAFPKTFPPQIVAIVRAGEDSPREMPEIFKKLSSRAAKDSSQFSKILGAFIYPTILFAISTIATIVLSIKAVPAFVTMFEELGATIPRSTQLVADIGNFLRDWGLIIIPFLVVGFFVLRKPVKSIAKSMFVTKILLHSPITGKLLKYMAITRTLNTYAALKRSEVNTAKLLTLTAKSAGNPVFEGFYNAIHRRLQEDGTSIEDGFRIERHRIGKDGDYIAAKCALGQKTISVDAIFSEVAAEYEDLLDEYLSQIPKLISMPLSMLAFGPVILLAIAMLSPMPELIVHVMKQAQ